MNDQRYEFIFNYPEKERLDVFLVGCLPEYSRARIQELIKKGHVTVDGNIVIKPGINLDNRVLIINVKVPLIKPTRLIPEEIPLSIIYENEDIMIVNKPAGMVVHPSPGHDHGTLVHAILGYHPKLQGIGGEERPGIVHRLDKDTSGLLVVAKSDQAHRWLQDQFRNRSVQKWYLALVDGKPPTQNGRVEAPIGRNITHRKLMAVVPDDKGRVAISEYRTLESFPAHTLLEVHPLTGRTHQIRVHMAFLGCSIAGDRVYGKKRATLGLARHFLHAHRLVITLPNEKVPREFKAEVPDDLISVLSSLKN